MEALTSSDFELRKPKVLFFDIETAPNRMLAWQTFQTDAVKVESSWYMLAWSAKWQGGKQVTKCLADYPGYDPTSEDDKALVTELWELLDKADIVIGHNGDRFDIKKTNARCIIHGLNPPEPYKTVDTLKVAKRHFAFHSNRLNELGKVLGVGQKVSTGGFELWDACMRGDLKAWNRMKKYNAQDVRLLEAVYERLKPWIGSHPNIALMSGLESGCPNCGGTDLVHRGFAYTRTGKSRRYRCKVCGAYSSGKHVKMTDVR